MAQVRRQLHIGQILALSGETPGPGGLDGDLAIPFEQVECGKISAAMY
jgi:hypothetical protein